MIRRYDIFGHAIGDNATSSLPEIRRLAIGIPIVAFLLLFRWFDWIGPWLDFILCPVLFFWGMAQVVWLMGRSMGVDGGQHRRLGARSIIFGSRALQILRLRSPRNALSLSGMRKNHRVESGVIRIRTA